MSTPEDAKPEVTATERVKYVEVAPKSGWQSMAKTVRDSDEDRIRDTKEDIDTLLVFAGLFSAVLSAFLVESYQALQPDSQGQMILLLQTIASQNYTFHSGLLNITSPVQALPPFEPPAWALRVNGLWFASLIVSLATASFGMLVKSWLREYLAVDQLAPQLRLRARQYRYPGLQKWKVFEIAAALPLLLQLALGLFFLGLCFFTAEIDSRMSLTSLPLVSAWAFFLLMTAIAPLVSPRCPFKLFLLKRTLKGARRWVRPVALSVFKISSQWIYVLLDVRHWDPLVTLSVTISQWSTQIDLWPGEKMFPQDEEEDVIAGGQEDTEILSATDAMILDDGLLDVMLEALQQSRSEPPVIIEFVLRLITNRIPLRDDLPAGNLSVILNLTALSRRAYIAIMEMVAESLRGELSPLSTSSTTWMKDAVFLLLSASPYPLPDAARRTLSKCINDAQFDSPAGTTLGRHLHQSAKEHWPLFVIPRTLLPICNARYLTDMSSVLQIYNALLEGLTSVEPLLLQTVQRHVDLARHLEARPIFESLWFILTHVVEADSSTVTQFWPGSDECFHLALNLADGLGKVDEIARMFAVWWGHSRNHYRAMCCYAALTPQARIADDRILAIIGSAFEQSAIDTRIGILRSSSNTNQSYSQGEYVEDYWVALDIVRFFAVHLSVYEHWLLHNSMSLVQNPAALNDGQDDECRTNERLEKAWTALWDSSSQALRYYWDERGWLRKSIFLGYMNTNFPVLSDEETLEQDREIASDCLERIRAIDEARQAGKEPNGPENDHSPELFPTTLYQALETFILQPDNDMGSLSGKGVSITVEAAASPSDTPVSDYASVTSGVLSSPTTPQDEGMPSRQGLTLAEITQCGDARMKTSNGILEDGPSIRMGT